MEFWTRRKTIELVTIRRSVANISCYFFRWLSRRATFLFYSFFLHSQSYYHSWRHYDDDLMSLQYLSYLQGTALHSSSWDAYFSQTLRHTVLFKHSNTFKCFTVKYNSHCLRWFYLSVYICVTIGIVFNYLRLPKCLLIIIALQNALPAVRRY